MRSYGQYCAVAKALDVIGERWTLLIVRELLLRGACRYTDLRGGLPGIATNLLADRLRDLEQAGVVAREDAPPPIATTIYRLTARGEQLARVILELGRWGGPLMSESSPDDEFRSHWLRLPVELYLRDGRPDLPPVTIELRTGEQPMVIEAGGGEVHVRPGSADEPDATLSGPPQPTLALLTGRVGLAQARRQGVHYRGDPDALRRLVPDATA